MQQKDGFKKYKKGGTTNPKECTKSFGSVDSLTPLKGYKGYTTKGKKNAQNEVDLSTLLEYLISNLPDFKAELTQLQFMARKFGATVKCSPKYHPEIAGKGIEFNWGCAKKWYRQQPLRLKQTKALYRDLVNAATNIEVLSLDRVRMFAARQRSYILTYNYLIGQEEAEGGHVEQDRPIILMPKMSESLIQRIQRQIRKGHKSHHEMRDIDSGYLDDVLSSVKARLSNQVLQENNNHN